MRASPGRRRAARSFTLLLVAALAAGAVWTLPPGFGRFRLRSEVSLRPDGHAGSISALAFSADGERLASAGWEGSLRLWRRRDGFLLGRSPLRQPAERLAISGDEVWGRGGEARVWRWSPGGEVAAVGSCRSPSTALPPGLCGAPTPGEEPVEIGLHGAASATAVAGDGGAARGEWSGAIRLEDARGQLVDRLGAPALTVAASPGGAYLASSHGFGLLGEGEIRLLDRRGGLLRRLRHPGGVAVCVAFAADDGTLLARDRQRRLVSWRLPDGAMAEGVPAGIAEACPQPDGRSLEVVIWPQVREAETLLLDRGTGWAASLTERYLRVALRRRGALDRLLGRVPLFALDLDGNLVLSVATPRWPSAMVCLAAMALWLASTSAVRWWRRAGRADVVSG